MSEGQTLGRDKNSADTDTPDDWENATGNQADPFGINAALAHTMGARNIDIPEFGDYVFGMLNIAVISIILFCKRSRKRLTTNPQKYHSKTTNSKRQPTKLR